MMEYQKPYLLLWTAITNALENLKTGNNYGAIEVLLKGQIAAEEAYIAWEEENKTLF